MANGRPTGDGSDRPSSAGRRKSANEEGLAALGRQMRGGPGSVPNETGLRSLGARIDASSSKGKGRRRSGKPKWSAGKKVLVGSAALIVLVVAVVGGGYAYLWYR